ncbi:PREDICTED: uncharacterized protein LOC108794750 [Nanorana parkeri]|uniref:uncharacterized protein LOC108794750 n=1 Tax=Nanorana parkeri TaxID=125878 RepID=UPI0008548958|nr:PREDICTED: uncharacterized protein LOC108794750 [Nanorana parkeri]
MERAAPWTEPEVRALISIWSEESIKRQLQGTLRNKGLFMYIALRMRQLGIFRDWKQCRSKYKNLKYEYRALRSSTREPVHKIPFYDELHAILGAEGAPQGGSEAGPEEDTCPEQAAEPDLQSPGGGTSDLLLVPAVHNEGGKHWSARETLALINIWSDKSIKGQLKGTVRNQKIFEHIAGLLQQSGIDRDWRQCRTKYKNLKHEYAVVKKAHDSGNRWKTMKYFKELDAILSGKPSGYRKINNDKPSSVPCPRPVPATVAADCLSGLISEIPEGNPVGHNTPIIKQELNTSGQCHESEQHDLSTRGNVVAIHIKEESSSVDDNPEMDDNPDDDFRIRTINDAGGGRNWSDYEVQSLLRVWSDEKISLRLDGTFRNKQVFEEISLRLIEFGINRDWKQCRRKYKNLKYEYHCIQKDENNENQRTMRQTVKFFDQIDCILRHLPKVTAQVAEYGPHGGVPNQGICQEEPRTVSGAQDILGYVLEKDEKCFGVLKVVVTECKELHNLKIFVFHIQVGKKITLIKPYMLAWDQDLGEVASEEDWKRRSRVTTRGLLNVSLSEANFKVFSRWYLVPSRLALMYPGTSPLCFRGCALEGTMYHIWWTCPRIRNFWGGVFNLIFRVVGIRVPRDPRLALLNDTIPETPKHTRRLINFIVLAAKVTIAKTWKTPRVPLSQNFIVQIKRNMHGFTLQQNTRRISMLLSDHVKILQQLD